MRKLVRKGPERTTARISLETLEALRQQRHRLTLLLGREVSNDEVIQAMHVIFVRQPEQVAVEAVRS